MSAVRKVIRASGPDVKTTIDTNAELGLCDERK